MCVSVCVFGLLCLMSRTGEHCMCVSGVLLYWLTTCVCVSGLLCVNTQVNTVCGCFWCTLVLVNTVYVFLVYSVLHWCTACVVVIYLLLPTPFVFLVYSVSDTGEHHV